MEWGAVLFVLSLCVTLTLGAVTGANVTTIGLLAFGMAAMLSFGLANRASQRGSDSGFFLTIYTMIFLVGFVIGLVYAQFKFGTIQPIFDAIMKTLFR